MAEPTFVSGAPAGSPTAAPDNLTAELLAKHAAGEKLSPSEYGKLGAFARKVKGLFGKAGAAPGSAEPGPAVGHAAGLASVAPRTIPVDGLEPVPVDAGICRRTTAAILGRCDLITARWLETHAQRAGATGATLDRFRAAAALPPDDKALLIDLSPDVLSELGFDPRTYPLWVAGGILGLHLTNLWLCVDELKRMNQERAAKEKPTPPTAETKTCH